MGSFFDLNSPASKFLTSVCNLILVNTLFIITCLPIVTIGASICGLYKILFEIINHEEVSVFKDYLKEFKTSFKNATIVWIPMLIILGFFGLEVYWIVSGVPGTAEWMVVPIFIVAAIILCIAIYYFPLLAVFDNTPKETIVNSILIGIGNFPITIMILILHFFYGFTLSLGNVASVVLGSLSAFIAIAVLEWVCAVFINRAIPASTKVEYNDEPDEDGDSDEEIDEEIDEDEESTEE